MKRKILAVFGAVAILTMLILNIKEARAYIYPDPNCADWCSWNYMDKCSLHTPNYDKICYNYNWPP